MDIEQRCSVCKGTGEILDYTEGEDIPATGIPCPRCEATGKLDWGKVTDLEDEVNNIKDKQNNILDKLNDILELLQT